jgi:hypothetical protein
MLLSLVIIYQLFQLSIISEGNDVRRPFLFLALVTPKRGQPNKYKQYVGEDV